jgi:preprotein translocase subunit SecE
MPADARERGGIQQLFREVLAELKRVIWPTGRQTVNYTGFVVLTVAVTVVITVVLDAIFNAGLGLLH